MPGLVFVTAYEEYALKAFEVDAIDYLQKPVTPDRFNAAVRRALGRLGQSAGARADLVRAREAEPGVAGHMHHRVTLAPHEPFR